MKRQKGQIAILIPIIILIAGLILLAPPKREKSENDTPLKCLIGEDITENQTLELPPINNLSKPDEVDDPTVGQDGGPNLSAPKVGYRLVRAKVPIDPIDSWSNKRLLPRPPSRDSTEASLLHFIYYGDKLIDGVNFEVYYPNKFGESTLDRSFHFKYGDSPEFRFHQEGILFFLRLKNGVPETIRGVDRRDPSRQVDFWLVDIYQEEGRYQASLRSVRGYSQQDVFRCQGDMAKIAYKPQLTPTVNPGDSEEKKELQLRFLVVKGEPEVNVGFSAHCKPAIYLYPEKPTNVNVKVKTKGELLYTRPLYPANGWNVLAYPDGKIVYRGKSYDYLYYESRIPDDLIDKPKEGFTVSYKELPNLYDDILPKLGLSDNQVAGFKEYWERTLPASPYYFIGIMSEENINDFEPLDVNPKPATIIRVRLYFEALDKKIEIQEPKIQTPKKTGFSLVEWGGMVKIDKDHPFTCSQ